MHIAINIKMFNNNASRNLTTTKDASNIREVILEKNLNSCWRIYDNFMVYKSF